MERLTSIDPARQSRQAIENESRPGTENKAPSNASPERTSKAAQEKDRLSLSEEALELQKLAERDREVRDHEAAHAAIGGSLAGPPKLAYTTGPDGRRYAVGGEVSIDMSPVPNNPEATIRKAETIRAAALAPVNPSPRDLSIAAESAQMMANARAEMALNQTKEMGGQPRQESNGESHTVSAESQPQTNRIFKGLQQAPEDSLPGKALSLYG